MPAAVIEVVSAGLLGGLALRVHPVLVLCALALMVEAALILGGIDANVRRLPNAVMVPTFVAVFALLVAAAIVDHEPHHLLRAIIGGASAFTAYTLLAIVSSGLGFGDCKLAALIGLVLGWLGWSALFAGVTLGFLLAALYLLPWVVSGRIARSDRFAFGPFMLVGAVAVLLIVG
jgi:leader peptidase (prepilin peptidase)/N-methyltransferase